ncbi:MAG TPA: ferritin-like domain-containing protein [Candidatus Acidoferrum sp.]|nr:ferritin-like domain-containing protein [Candidatus Acidoferrum sp.]
MKKEENNLQELLVEEMRDVYHAEQQLLKALPKMAKAAQSERLKEAFERHLEETEQHVERLERAFEALGETAKAKTCKAMQGLIEEGKEMMEAHKDSATADAALIAAAQKVEHYEIATYGTLCTWCDLLGLDEASELLKETLDEEKTTDELLTEIAESEINAEAVSDKEEE